jgi:hypothetical protein
MNVDFSGYTIWKNGEILEEKRDNYGGYPATDWKDYNQTDCHLLMIIRNRIPTGFSY